MTAQLGSKLCVVTGVTSGIGRATAEHLIGAGASVAGIARDPNKLRLAADELGQRFVPIVADLAHSENRRRAVREVSKLDRPIDVFVSNAAECSYASPEHIDVARFQRLLEVNVSAALELTQGLVPLMRAGSHIVQLSSVTAKHVPNAKFAPYAATKAAVEHLVEALRLELHPRDVHVSVVRPGLVDTPIYSKVEGFERAKAKLLEQVPRWLEPDDVASAIVWLLCQPRHVVVSELTLLPSQQTR